MRWLTGALLACALVFAAAPASARSDGWKTHQVRAAGFRVDAPETWIDATRLTPQVLSKMSQIPSLRQYVELAKQSKAVKLILVDASAATVRNHYATNMNVVMSPTVADLELLRAASVAQLSSLGVVVGKVASRFVTLPAGKAVELRYRARYSATSPILSQLQYLLVHNGSSTVLTYTTLPKVQSAYAGTFLRSAQSFRYL